MPRGLVLALVLLAGCGGCGEGEPRLAFAKLHVGWLPRDYKRGTATTSFDGTRYTCVEQVAGSERVIEQGAAGPAFTKVTAPRFAPRGERVAYVGKHEGEGPHVEVAVGGQVVPTGFASGGDIVLARDGRRWAAVGWEGDATADPPVGLMAVYVDGQGPARYPDASQPTFSPDGAHVAYLVRDEAGRIELVVDGRVRERYPEPEGKCSAPRQAAPGSSGMASQFGAHYLTDGSLLVLTRSATCWTLLRDATRLAAYPNSVVKDPNQFLFDPEFTPRPSILPASLVVAEAAPVVAWWERLDGDPDRWRVVRDGQPVDDSVCMTIADDQPIALSPDGRHVMHSCVTPEEGGETRVRVVIDGVVEGPYRFVWGLAFSADGRHYGYAASYGTEDPWRFYVDGKVQPGGWKHVFPPVFSDDGSHVVWAAFLDERLGLFVDGHHVATADQALRPPRFTAANELVWAVRRGRRVVRLTMRDIPRRPPGTGARQS